MTINNDSQNGSNGTGANPEVPADDSDPTGRYRSSAAGQVQQNIADAGNDASSPSAEPVADAAPEAEPAPTPSPEERFPWTKDTRQWGVRAPLTQHGLTVESIAIGVYGEIPDESREMTRHCPRSCPRRGCLGWTTTR